MPPAPGVVDAMGDGLVDGEGEAEGEGLVEGEALGDGEAEGSVDGDGLGLVVWARVAEARVSTNAADMATTATGLLIFMAFI